MKCKFIQEIVSHCENIKEISEWFESVMNLIKEKCFVVQQIC